MPASFLISTNLLSVVFTDTTLSDDEVNNPVSSWAWDFGTSPASSATTQNTTKTYDAPGKYSVTLVVTFQDSTTSTVTRYVMVDTKPILPLTIADFVKAKLVSPFPINNESLDAQIKIWQLYIQPLVNTPGVNEADTFNESAYPAIINALVAYCVSYQLILDLLGSSAAFAVGSGIGDNPGIVKSMETGPANAHFQDPATYLKYLNGPGGLLETIRTQMCSIAFRCRINIPFCPPLPKPKFIPLKAGRPDSIYSQVSEVNAWTITPFALIPSV